MLDRQAVITELSPHPHTSIFKLYFEVGEWDSYPLIRAVFLVEFKKNVQLLTFVGLLDQDSSVLFVLLFFVFLYAGLFWKCRLPGSKPLSYG